MQIYSDFSYQTLNRSSERTTTLRVLGCYLLNVDAVMLDGWMDVWDGWLVGAMRHFSFFSFFCCCFLYASFGCIAAMLLLLLLSGAVAQNRQDFFGSIYHALHCLNSMNFLSKYIVRISIAATTLLRAKPILEIIEHFK